MQSHIGSICLISLQSGFLYMSFQVACLTRCIVTLVAFVRFFSWVDFQMCIQMACLYKCIVALIAFVWFLSRVSFQMGLQAFSPIRSKVTLVAYMRLLAWRWPIHPNNKLSTVYLLGDYLLFDELHFHFHSTHLSLNVEIPRNVTKASFHGDIFPSGGNMVVRNALLLPLLIININILTLRPLFTTLSSCHITLELRIWIDNLQSL